jgi:hypothetical protein
MFHFVHGVSKPLPGGVQLLQAPHAVHGPVLETLVF